jgi:hypothetical protein
MGCTCNSDAEIKCSQNFVEEKGNVKIVPVAKHHAMKVS